MGCEIVLYCSCLSVTFGKRARTGGEESSQVSEYPAVSLPALRWHLLVNHDAGG